MTQGPAKRVAVVGARGIGRHHAKWWALEGAEVCGFVGTTPESVAQTKQALHALFGYDGPGYTRLDELLEKEQPEFVDVCSPPACHAAHVRTALEAGCHVLCEKPFVYDAAQPPDALLAEARALTALAEERGLLLGVCTQYTAGAAEFARIWRAHQGDAPIEHYHGHLEAPARGRTPDPARVWVDMAPHPLSVALALCPDAEPDWTTLEAGFEGYEARAGFAARRPDGTTVDCDILTRNAADPPRNVRHFKLNGYAFEVEGENDAEGVYAARIDTPDGAHHAPDLMRVLIAAMLAGQPLASGTAALRNLEWMLQILDVARAIDEPR